MDSQTLTLNPRCELVDQGQCCCAAGHDEMHAAPAYTSPEGLNYFKQPETYLVGCTTDIWSMGCVLWELLTGQPAFCRPEDRALLPDNADRLRQLVLQRQAQRVGSQPDCSTGHS